MRPDLPGWLASGGGARDTTVPPKPLNLTPSSLGAAWASEAHPESGRCAGSDLPLPSCVPIQIHTFWIDAKNYVEVTRKWYAEAMPFPLNFFLPGRMQRQHIERLQLLCGEHRPESEDELEKEVPLGEGAVV